MFKVFGVIILCIVIYFGYSINEAYQKDEKRLTDHPCIQDWRKCKDIKELMSFSDIVGDAQSACTTYAEVDLPGSRARWDEDWAYGKFSIYFPKSPYKQTGELVLEDDRAIFTFSDGIDRRTPMICTYDMTTKKVDNVVVPHIY